MRGSKRQCRHARSHGGRCLLGPAVEALESRLLLAVNLMNPGVQQCSSPLPRSPLLTPSHFQREGTRRPSRSWSPMEALQRRCRMVSQSSSNPGSQPLPVSHGTIYPPVSEFKILPPATPPPMMLLEYELENSTTAAHPGTTMVSGPVESYPSPVVKVGSPNQDFPPPNPEDAELTPQGIQKLPALPVAGDVQVSGALGPGQTWATFKMPVGPSTQSLKVTVSHEETVPSPAIPALDQIYLVGPQGNLLAELKGASANFAGLRQDLTIALSGIPQGSQLVVRIVENLTVVSDSSVLQAALLGNLAFKMEVLRTEATSPITSTSFSGTGAALNSVGPLLIGSGTGAIALAPISLALSSGAFDLNSPVEEQTANSGGRRRPSSRPRCSRQRRRVCRSVHW